MSVIASFAPARHAESAKFHPDACKKAPLRTGTRLLPMRRTKHMEQLFCICLPKTSDSGFMQIRSTSTHVWAWPKSVQICERDLQGSIAPPDPSGWFLGTLLRHSSPVPLV